MTDRLFRLLGLRAVCVAGAALALVAPDIATAGNPTPSPNNSAVSQYVETIPTASGGTTANNGGNNDGTTSNAGKSAGGSTLPSAVTKKIRASAGKDSAALEHIATSASLGAPSKAPTAPATPRKNHTLAAEETKGGGHSGTSLTLLAIVLVGALAAFGAAAYRRRQRPPA